MRVLIAAGVMGIILLILRIILDHIFVTTTNTALGAGGTILAVFKLFVEIGVGLFIFVRAARFLDISELEILRRLTERLKPLLKRYNLLWLVSWI